MRGGVISRLKRVSGSRRYPVSRLHRDGEGDEVAVLCVNSPRQVDWIGPTVESRLDYGYIVSHLTLIIVRIPFIVALDFYTYFVTEYTFK